MNTKERIKAEIDNLSDEELDEIYTLIKRFTGARPNDKGQSALSRLRQIKIQGPHDFATNLDLYLNGEKREEPNLP
jgi:hypothetical protein